MCMLLRQLLLTVPADMARPCPPTPCGGWVEGVFQALLWRTFMSGCRLPPTMGAPMALKLYSLNSSVRHEPLQEHAQSSSQHVPAAPPSHRRQDDDTATPVRSLSSREAATDSGKAVNKPAGVWHVQRVKGRAKAKLKAELMGM
jgi:hypothetical protein